MNLAMLNTNSSVHLRRLLASSWHLSLVPTTSILRQMMRCGMLKHSHVYVGMVCSNHKALIWLNGAERLKSHLISFAFCNVEALVSNMLLILVCNTVGQSKQLETLSHRTKHHEADLSLSSSEDMSGMKVAGLLGTVGCSVMQRDHLLRQENEVAKLQWTIFLCLFNGFYMQVSHITCI